MAAELSWFEAFGRMQAIGFSTLHGRMRYRTPSGGGVRDGEVEFWHQPPEKWRVHDEHGLFHLHDGARLLVRAADGMELMPPTASMNFRQGHPRSLLGVQRSGRGIEHAWLHSFDTPRGPGVPAELAGRAAWEFALDAAKGKRSRKPYPLRVTIDDATGTPLGLAVPEADYFMEIIEFEPDSTLPDGIFAWDGTPSTKVYQERVRDEAALQWLNEQILPVPRWWPGGVGYEPGDGYPEAGSFQVTLDVPGFPELVRWPRDCQMPQRWSLRHESRHVHRWSDDRWEWALAVSEPLSEQDLADVIDSIPGD